MTDTYAKTVETIRNWDTQETIENLVEAIIDTKGLAELMEAATAVCDMKAEHLRANWATATGEKCTQAKVWERAAGRLCHWTAHDAIKHAAEYS